MIGFYWEAALLAWVGYGVWLLYRAWYSREQVAGILLAYYLNLFSGHIISEVLVVLSPSSTETRIDSDIGFAVTGWAVVGLVSGELLATAYLRRLRTGQPDRPQRQSVVAWRSAAVMTIAMGVMIFLFGRYFDLTSIPVVSTILGSCNLLAAAGFAWLWWDYYQEGQVGAGILILTGSLTLPIMTVVFSGFLGFGIQILLLISASVICVSRRQWWILALAPMFLYVGLTVFVSYMGGREEMRNSIWERNDTLSDRTQVIRDQFTSNLELFDPDDARHRYFVDTRLNQNYFVGLTSRRLDIGLYTLEYGESYGNAFWALVPRAIWPDKPVISGGSEQVSRYTGLMFHGATSVGEGHILDLYANFGARGLVVGMGVLGMLLTVIDRRAGEYMTGRSFDRFLVWFVAGATLCNGSVGRLSELPAAVIASVLMALGCQLVSRSTVAGPAEGR